jgi:hypothetical protein
VKSSARSNNSPVIPLVSGLASFAVVLAFVVLVFGSSKSQVKTSPLPDAAPTTAVVTAPANESAVVSSPVFDAKFTPVPLDRVATIVSTKGMFFGEDVEAERIVLPDWGPRTVEGVPFTFTDPQGDRVPNVVLMYGPQGKFPPRMPKSVSLPCNVPVRAVHMLSGIGGWAGSANGPKSHCLTVRVHYAGGGTEDHELQSGVHFADYIRRAEVPESKFAFRAAGGQQVRYLAVYPKERSVVERVELVKGPDGTAPIVVALTLERDG